MQIYIVFAFCHDYYNAEHRLQSALQGRVVQVLLRPKRRQEVGYANRSNVTEARNYASRRTNATNASDVTAVTQGENRRLFVVFAENLLAWHKGDKSYIVESAAKSSLCGSMA